MAQGDTSGVVMQSDIGSGASGGVAAQAQISGIFSASASYAIGTYVVNNGLLYRCTTPHSGAWNAAHFEQVTIGGELNTRTPVYGRGVNLLDNWYFIGGGSQQGGGQFPINQRGQTSYSNAGYGIDKWRALSNDITVSLTANGLSIDNGGTIAGAVVQRAPNLSRFLGKTYTVSILLSDRELAAGTFLVPSSVSGSAIVGTIYFTGGRVEFGYNTLNDWLYYSIVVNANTTVVVAVVKLELGSQQTLAHQDAGGNWVLNDPPPNFQQELAKCKAYQIVWKNSSGNVSFIGGGFVGTSTVARIKIPVGVYMRAQPVLKSLGTNSYTADDCSLVVDNRMIPVKSFDSLWVRDVDGFYVNANVDSSESMTVSSLAILRVNAGCAIIADAN